MNIWKESCDSKGFRVPKVTIGTPLMHFAEAVGELVASKCSSSLAAASTYSPSADSSSFSDNDSESRLCTVQDDEDIDSNVPRKDDFLLLHQFKIPIGKSIIRDKLMQEIVKYNGGE